MWKLRSSPILTVTPEYVEHRYIFKKVRLNWEEVAGIYGANWSRLTYDELFLYIRDANGRELATGQLDKGFDELERIVFEKFPSVSQKWRDELELRGVGSAATLWEKSAPNDQPIA